MEPGESRRLRFTEREYQQVRGGPAPAPHMPPHGKPAAPESLGDTLAQGVAPRDEDLVPSQRGGLLVAGGGGTAQENGVAELPIKGTQHPGTPHGIILRAPTHRSSQYAPSGSCGSRRDSFTPRFELWMNLSSPTYIPTCVTPAPGRAEKRSKSPGRSASTTGVTSAPARAWSRLMRGSRMPCWAYAYWISPEQSNPLSWVPPHTYGVPSDSIAVWTTSPALPLKVVGGSGGGSSGGALYPPLPRPPSPLPNPMETPMAALTPRCAPLLGRQNPRGPRSSSR